MSELEAPKVSTHECPKCGKETPNERQELTGSPLCIKCTPPMAKPLAVVEYNEKAGGVLYICRNKAEFDYLKKPANRRR